MEKILEVKGLCKTYIVNKKQNNVLRNIDLTVSEGEMVGVMGPSGSGKSTLLYTVSGMDQMTSGEVKFYGKDISKLPPDELAELRLDEMGFIFQQMYMLKNLTVLDNIILPAVRSEKNKASRSEKQQKGLELMKMLGISELADNDINEASGGQLQRACIARSMINSPKVIFADEPTGALNRTSSEEVTDKLNELNRMGTTVVLVTHDTHVAAKCDRILFIVDGTIKEEYNLGKYTGAATMRDRERKLSEWLMNMGW